MPSTTPTSKRRSGPAPATETRPVKSVASETRTSENAVPSPQAARVADAPSARSGAVRRGIVRIRTVPSNTARALRRLRDEAGAATAEYVIATMAAVGFAGLLILILRGDEVRGILTDLVRHALTVG
jgi:Flp pilus assembly pilin Flp